MRTFWTCFNLRGCFVDPYSDKLLGIFHEQNWDNALKLIRRGEGLRWSSFGWTMLHFAMWKAAPVNIVLAMLSGGLSANEKDNEDGKTAVHFAVQFNPSSVQALLEHAGDSNYEDNLGVTPVALAAAKGNVEVLDILLSAGGDPNKASFDGTTPLMQAATAPNGGACVLVLLKAGSDKDCIDLLGRTALDRLRTVDRPCKVALSLLDHRIGIIVAMCSAVTMMSYRKRPSQSPLSKLPKELIRMVDEMLR